MVNDLAFRISSSRTWSAGWDGGKRSGEKQGESKEHPTVSQDTWLAKILLSHRFLNHNRNNLVICNGID